MRFRLSVLCLAGCLWMRAAVAQTVDAGAHWVGAWAASQQIPEPQNALPAEEMHDATLRQIVFLSVGGDSIRVRLSNAFGTGPLHLVGVHVARPLSAAGAAIDPATDTAVRFGGREDVTIPAGAEYVSDPVTFHAAALSSLAISIRYDEPPARETGHPGSRSTTYAMPGDELAAATMPGAKTVDHWYQVSGVDVTAPAQAAAVVTLGDSITDGHAATTNGNDRWPDALARRLQASAATRTVSVLNQGIGGNRILLDGLGPNALARFDRDVVAQTGVKWVLVLEGVNDLGTLTRDGDASEAAHKDLVARLEGAYAQMVMRAHAHGIRVYGATILPYGGSRYYHPGSLSEGDREAVNAWIRAAGHFDAVVDFDQAMRDPAHPDHMLAAYDSGDGLHPSPAGYKAMGDAIPLTLFAP